MKFSIQIKAPKEKVWLALWDDRNYRLWTSVFCPGSYVETSWKEGSSALFLNGSGDGMYSVIEKNVEFEYMSFKHLGVIKAGKEMPQDEKTQNWSGSMENYRLEESNGYTTLGVEVDMEEEHQEMFSQLFPKGLEIVKEIAEG